MSAPMTPVRVAPGDGLVGRVGDGVLVVAGPIVEEQVTSLLTLLREACEGQDRPGRLLARRVAQHVFQTDPEAVPSFAVLAPTDDGWAVTLHGDVELSVVRGGTSEEPVSGRQAATWVDRIVPEGFDRLVVGPDVAALAAPSGPFDLQAGVVPGTGVVIAAGEPAQPRPAEAPAAGVDQPAAPQQRPAEPQPAPPSQGPPPAAPAEPSPQPAAPPAERSPEPPAAPAASSAPVDDTAEQSAVRLPSPEQAERQQTPPPAPSAATTDAFESVSLLQPAAVPQRDPLPVPGEAAADVEAPSRDAPLVKGVLCQNGHFNHPQARYCSVDGVSMVHRTLAPVQRPRPPLGVLVSDDGSAYSLDHDYLVGRDPDAEEGVVSGELTPLRLVDEERSVSRVHAEIRLDGWDVTVVDRESANGTYVAARTETDWRRLAPGRPEIVAPGTRIAFGKRVLTFDSHHQT